MPSRLRSKARPSRECGRRLRARSDPSEQGVKHMNTMTVACAKPHTSELVDNRFRVFGRAAFALAASIAALSVHPARAAIPDSERQALIEIYNATDGQNWYRNGGWFGDPGTECGWDPLLAPDAGWEGVMCTEDESNVLVINLGSNNLKGSFPDLSTFSHLYTAWLMDNPGLPTKLPDLSNLASLERLDISNCSFSGSLPEADKLPPNLKELVMQWNSFSGDVPAPMGPPSLEIYAVYGNQLNGRILGFEGNPNLVWFSAPSTGLTGPIPSLEGLTRLWKLEIGYNALTGNFPDISSNKSLKEVYAQFNQLDGHIVSLDGATSLEKFWVNSNKLTGSLPSISTLNNLQVLAISDNRLTGNLPNPPSNVAGDFFICPNNYFNPTPSPEWDKATRHTPWYDNCSPPPDALFADGFDAGAE